MDLFCIVVVWLIVILILLPTMVNPDVIYYHLVKNVWFHITCLQRNNITGIPLIYGTQVKASSYNCMSYVWAS